MRFFHVVACQITTDPDKNWIFEVHDVNRALEYLTCLQVRPVGCCRLIFIVLM